MSGTAYLIEDKENFTLITIQVPKFTAQFSPDVKTELVVLKDRGVKNIIFNLENSDYCDSSGLSAVLVANRVCNEAKGCMVVCSLQPAVEKLIKISQLTNVLNITPTLDEAIDFVFMDELEKGLGEFDEADLD